MFLQEGTIYIFSAYLQSQVAAVTLAVLLVMFMPIFCRSILYNVGYPQSGEGDHSSLLLQGIDRVREGGQCHGRLHS